MKKRIGEKNKKYLGCHLIAEFWQGRVIRNPKEIRMILMGATKAAHNTPLAIKVHQFSPQGLTAVALLAESDSGLDCWREVDYLAIDIFTCGQKALPYKALAYLKKQFKPKRVEIKEIKRGKI